MKIPLFQQTLAECRLWLVVHHWMESQTTTEYLVFKRWQHRNCRKSFNILDQIRFRRSRDVIGSIFLQFDTTSLFIHEEKQRSAVTDIVDKCLFLLFCGYSSANPYWAASDMISTSAFFSIAGVISALSFTTNFARAFDHRFVKRNNIRVIFMSGIGILTLPMWKIEQNSLFCCALSEKLDIKQRIKQKDSYPFYF